MRRMLISLDPRRAALVMLAIAAAMLLTVYAMQHLGGLEPCPLCVWQRYPWFAVLGIGLLTPAVGRDGARMLLGAMGAALVVGIVIAGYHVGVEQLWWEGSSTCVGDDGGEAPASLAALRELAMGAPAPRCDVPAWTLFGISLTGYNLLASLALAALCLTRAALPGGPRR